MRSAVSDHEASAHLAAITADAPATVTGDHSNGAVSVIHTLRETRRRKPLEMRVRHPPPEAKRKPERHYPRHVQAVQPPQGIHAPRTRPPCSTHDWPNLFPSAPRPVKPVNRLKAPTPSRPALRSSRLRRTLCLVLPARLVVRLSPISVLSPPSMPHFPFFLSCLLSSPSPPACAPCPYSIPPSNPSSTTTSGLHPTPTNQTMTKECRVGGVGCRTRPETPPHKGFEGGRYTTRCVADCVAT